MSSIGLGFGGGDEQEHIAMANDSNYNSTYAPLFRQFSPLFTTQPLMWTFLNFFLLIIVPCYLIFLITQEKLTPVFYFAVSNLVYFFLASLFAQLLVFIFVLGLFATKDNRVRLVIVFVGSLSHTYAPLLLPGVWLLIFLNELASPYLLKLIAWIKNKLPNVVLATIGGCSPFWGREIPSTLNSPIGGSSYVPSMITMNKLFAFFIKVSPLPFVFVAFREFVRRGRFDFVALWFLGFVGAWFFGDRVWYLSGLVTVVGFCWAWKDLTHKKFWLVLVLFYLVFLFQQFVWGRLFC